MVSRPALAYVGSLRVDTVSPNAGVLLTLININAFPSEVQFKPLLAFTAVTSRGRDTPPVEAEVLIQPAEVDLRSGDVDWNNTWHDGSMGWHGVREEHRGAIVVWRKHWGKPGNPWDFWPDGDQACENAQFPELIRGSDGAHFRGTGGARGPAPSGIATALHPGQHLLQLVPATAIGERGEAVAGTDICGKGRKWLVFNS